MKEGWFDCATLKTLSELTFLSWLPSFSGNCDTRGCADVDVSGAVAGAIVSPTVKSMKSNEMNVV